MIPIGKFVDLTGERFGRLTVIRRGENYVSPKGYVGVNWICECDCGRTTLVRGCNLKSGASISCGCERVIHPNRKTHGLSHTRLHSIWSDIKTRCFDPNDSNYSNYGGRGITMCDEWRSDFLSFYRWANANGYSDDLSIDRIDNNLGYCPDNCRWADSVVQQNNKRNNHLITYHGETLTMSQWARKTGIGFHKLKDRINKLHWDVDRALTQE